MKITKHLLLSQPNNFWKELIFLLWGTSPYFGKLDWKFSPKLGTKLPQIEESSLDYLKEEIEELPDDLEEELLGLILMTILFRVAPNYNRTRVSTPTYENDEPQQRIIEELGLERLPRYPSYHITPAPQDYRPLKREEIDKEDLIKFKQKINIVANSNTGELLGRLRTLWNHSQQQDLKLKKLNHQLRDWIQLISKHLEN